MSDDFNSLTKKVSQKENDLNELVSNSRNLKNKYQNKSIDPSIKHNNRYSKISEIKKVPSHLNNSRSNFKRINVIKDLVLNNKNSQSNNTMHKSSSLLNNTSSLLNNTSNNSLNSLILTDTPNSLNNNQMYQSQFASVDEIFKDFAIIKDYRAKIIRDQQRKNNKLNSSNSQLKLDRSNFSPELEIENIQNKTLQDTRKINLKYDFKPKISPRSESLAMKTRYSSPSSIFDKLYTTHKKDQSLILLDENLSLKPSINPHSVEILKSSNKLYDKDEIFNKNYLEQKNRMDKLSQKISNLNDQFSFKPTCNESKDLNWSWESFIDKNQNSYLEKLSKNNEYTDLTEYQPNMTLFPQINDESIKILIDSGVVDSDKNIDINQFNQMDRLKIYSRHDDFQQRLYDIDEIMDKIKKLKRDKQRIEMKHSTKIPKINPYSKEISLQKITELEEIGFQSRKHERDEHEKKLRQKEMEKNKKNESLSRITRKEIKRPSNSTDEVLNVHKIKQFIKNNIMGTLGVSGNEEDNVKGKHASNSGNCNLNQLNPTADNGKRHSKVSFK